jgi:Carboxypeptidase regulatory-like domain
VHRGVAGLVAVTLLSGCGSGGEYAGLTREEAARESARVARQMREPVAVIDLWEPRKRVPIGTWRSRDSSGEAAWVTVFRLTGVENDTDQACVWANREASRPTRFEEAPSVAWGIIGDRAHDRCAEEVIERGIAGLEQTIGSEVSSPPVAHPDVVAPFASWEARVPPAQYSGGSAITLTAQELLLPRKVPPGTCGFAGFVVDDATYRPLAGARVRVAPRGGSGGLAATTDAFGSFAFSGLPVVERGFDFTVRAAGYRTSRTLGEHCYPGGFGVGDWSLVRARTSAER